MVLAYILLHSKFIWLQLAIASTICSLVASSGALTVWVGSADATTGMGCAGTTGVLVAAGSNGLNAVRTWAAVNVLICSMSFIMQNPLFCGTMTSVRWNERSGRSLDCVFGRNDEDDALDAAVAFSRNIPVMVIIIIAGWKSKEMI